MSSFASSEIIFFLTSALILFSYAFLVSRNMLSPLVLSTNPFANLRSFLTLVLLFHSLYIIHALSVLRPPNLFSLLGVSLGEATDTIRRIVAKVQADSNLARALPHSMDILLGRLGSYEMRGVYVRFGHHVLTMCEYCRNADEFAFFAFPGVLLQYLREMALIGVLTIRGTEREAWRRLAIWGLIIAGMAEVYFVATWNIIIPRPQSPNPLERKEPWMVHDVAWFLRYLFFLIFPILVHSLPARKPSALDHASIALAQTLPVLQQTITNMKHFSLLWATSQRMPALREQMGGFWDSRRQMGEAVRQDEGVRSIAHGLGLGYEEVISGQQSKKQGASVPLRENARQAANEVVDKVFNLATGH